MMYDIEKEIKRDPITILSIVIDNIVHERRDISSDEYYEILRLRHFLTPKILKKKAAPIIKEAFESGRAYYFIRALNELELLEKVFPGIWALIRVDGGHYHNESVYTHVAGALRALDSIKLPYTVKLAALYHDVGKCQWEISDEGKRRFTNHASRGVPIVAKDLAALGLPREDINLVKNLVGLHMSQIDGPHSIRKLDRNLSINNIPRKYFFWVRYADNKGSAVHKTDFMYYWRLYLHFCRTLYVRKEPSVTDLAVNGKDLMKEFNMPGGKWLGNLLKYLFVGVQERSWANEYDFLIKKSHEFMDWFDTDTK